MTILIVGGDDALLPSLTEELESRDFEVLPTHFVGMGDWTFTRSRVRLHSCSWIIVSYRARRSRMQFNC